MGYAQRNILPDKGGYTLEFGATKPTIQSFDGDKAIQVHRDHVAKFKDYLYARTKEIPDLPLACYSQCVVIQWMYSEQVNECANKKLIESACKCCEEFHEIAAQSVLLTKMDMPEPFSEVIQSALDFEKASCKFQQAIVALHIECKLNQ